MRIYFEDWRNGQEVKLGRRRGWGGEGEEEVGRPVGRRGEGGVRRGGRAHVNSCVVSFSMSYSFLDMGK